MNINFNNSEFETSFGITSQLTVSDKAEIVVCGRSNVGKSTLINKLLNRKSLAKVSSKPGKTITINFYNVDKIRLVDLPGYGYAKVSDDEIERFSTLIDNYFTSGRNIKYIVILIDCRRPPTDLDLMIYDFTKKFKFKYLIVYTKCDKFNVQQKKDFIINQSTHFNAENDFVMFSSLKNEGIEEIRNYINNNVEE